MNLIHSFFFFKLTRYVMGNNDLREMSKAWVDDQSEVLERTAQNIIMKL